MRRLNPEIAAAYADYRSARAQSLVPVRIPTKDGKSERLAIVEYTTGLAHLPAAGGLEDQPYRLMKFWSLFQEGDHLAIRKSLA